MFTLHPRLAADTLAIGHLPLSRLLLMNDAHYPWVVLVPQRDGISEIYQLSEADQLQLLHESSTVGRVMMELFHGDKLNIGALGNMVPQLHVHHIVRFRDDPAWPGPVWGAHPAQAYGEAEAAARIAQIHAALAMELSLTLQAAQP